MKLLKSNHTHQPNNPAFMTADDAERLSSTEGFNYAVRRKFNDSMEAIEQRARFGYSQVYVGKLDQSDNAAHRAAGAMLQQMGYHVECGQISWGKMGKKAANFQRANKLFYWIVPPFCGLVAILGLLGAGIGPCR